MLNATDIKAVSSVTNKVSWTTTTLIRVNTYNTEMYRTVTERTLNTNNECKVLVCSVSRSQWANIIWIAKMTKHVVILSCQLIIINHPSCAKWYQMSGPGLTIEQICWIITWSSMTTIAFQI